MPTTYTPSTSFPPYPLTLITQGDLLIEDTFNDVFKQLADGIEHLRDGLEGSTGTTGRFDALLSKLGLTVINDGDLAEPTYASLFQLVGSMSHHEALELLDNYLSTLTTRVNNITTNVGGNVDLGASPVYATPNIVANGDSHHVALEKIDVHASTTRTIADTNTTDIGTLNTKVSNMITKLGVDADTAIPWDFTANNFIVDGQAVRTILDDYDKLFGGVRRQALHDFEHVAEQYRQLENNQTTPYAITGTVTLTNGSTAVSGVGTSFLTQLSNHRYIHLDSDGAFFTARVERVVDNTNATLSRAYPGVGGGPAAASRMGPKHLFFEDFRDLTKQHGTSTAAIDTLQQKATGVSTKYVALTVSPETVSFVKFYAKFSGVVTLKANAIGSLSDGDFTTITEQAVWTSLTAGSGTSLVVRVDISGAAEIYNLIVLAY